MTTGTQAASAQAGASIARPADFKTETDALVQAAFPADGPGAAVIVTRGGRVIYSAGRGLADVEAGRPITPGTLFKLGSIAKQFTAALILQLVAEKQISLDDPISRFFPIFRLPAEPPPSASS
jgi:CubicO group peptidase (beta-lactamase class C family)